jgi:RHS repeat-associated protein
MVVGTNPDGYVETQNTVTVNGASETLAAHGLTEQYGYDSFGNMEQSGLYTFMQPYNAANQLSGWSYDAAGNLLADAFGNMYQYDAEGKINNVSGTSYVYDAEARRVEKSGTTVVDTIYFGGRPLGRLSGGAWTDLIYGVGGLLAEVTGTQTGQPLYRMTDHLGSLVGTLSSTGSVLSTQDVASFGEVIAGGSSDPYVFTGKERDTESGNDYFGARYYDSNMGRFMSPDPSQLYYADPTNPQSLNLYSYVLNNPLRNIDPDGLNCYWDDGTHDDPSDGGASQGDCSDQGGTWIDKPTTFVSVTANPNNDDVSTTSVTISTPLGYQQCQPTSFKVTGVGPNQAPGNGAFTGQPPTNGQVAIKPQNFGVPYNTVAQRNAAQSSNVSSVVSNIVIFPNYGTASTPASVPQTPFGAPSGPYTPADAIGPASVRNSPGNQIDVYRYASQRNALASTRTTTPTIFVPINSSGVGCPN